jgi:hypothetical protein
MSEAENIYNIADNHARTVRVCIDRLYELGANEQLNVLSERLQKLAARATAEDDRKGSQIAPHNPALATLLGGYHERVH